MRFFKLLTAFCLLFTVSFACTKGGKDAGVKGSLIGSPAPDFKLKEMHDADISLSDMKGKVVLLRFWSTRCVSCKEEMPKLEDSYKELKDKGFEILAVNVEDARDKAMNFAHELKLTYPILLDEDQRVAEKYNVYGIPTSFFIDKDGVVRERVFGDLDENRIKGIVMPLLAGKEVLPSADEKKGVFVPLKDTGSAASVSPQGNAIVPTFGDFTLTNHNGKKTSLHDFKGKAVLMFFGYTNCPDVCPTGLRQINSALQLLGKHAKDVQVLFISIDPERDTPEKLKEYVPYFNPSFIGLTGSKDEVDKVAKQYGAMYEKEKPDEKGYYAVGHSTSIYLIDKEGSFKYLFSFYTEKGEMAKVVREYLK